MPLKSERTSYNVSSNLKTALQAKGYDTSVKEGKTYYDGGATEIHLALLDLSDGTFRSVVNTASFCDIIAANDPALVRMWVEPELYVFIAVIPGVESSESVLNGSTWTHTIVFNGTPQTGTDTKKVDAMVRR